MALIHLVVFVSLQTAEVVQFILVKDQKKVPIRRAGTVALKMCISTVVCFAVFLMPFPVQTLSNMW